MNNDSYAFHSSICKAKGLQNSFPTQHQHCLWNFPASSSYISEFLSMLGKYDLLYSHSMFPVRDSKLIKLPVLILFLFLFIFFSPIDSTTVLPPGLLLTNSSFLIINVNYSSTYVQPIEKFYEFIWTKILRTCPEAKYQWIEEMLWRVAALQFLLSIYNRRI